MQYTVIIPTFNEVENIPKIVPTLLELPLPGLKVMVVDDNSPDGTGKVANSLADQYPDRVSVIHRQGERGFGASYIQGFRQALAEGADFVTQMDADFSHPPEKILDFSEAIKTNDIVIGSRYVRGGAVDEKWPIWRKGLSAFGNFYARMILNSSVLDITGGYRMWRREVLKRMPLDRVRSNGYSFQIEMFYIAQRLGFKIVEVPIYFAERDVGDSKMSLRIQIEAALRVWQIRGSYRDLVPGSDSMDGLSDPTV
jgi:dolichol-phosphate mannosyltransferase